MADRLSGYTSNSDPKFRAWMTKVDAAVNRMVGLSVMDLSDIDFWSLFNDKVTPSRAAAMAMRESGW